MQGVQEERQIYSLINHLSQSELPGRLCSVPWLFSCAALPATSLSLSDGPCSTLHIIRARHHWTQSLVLVSVLWVRYLASFLTLIVTSFH